MQSRARRRYGADDTGDSFAVITIGADGQVATNNGGHQRKEEDLPEKPKYPPPSAATSWLPSISQRIFASVAPTPTKPEPRNAWNDPQQKAVGNNHQGGGFWGHSNNGDAAAAPYDEDDDLFSKENLVPEFTMTARDRSGEFASAIRSLQGRNIQRAVNLKDPRKAKHMQSYAEFMMIAKHIGKNIASTYTKLEKLTLLAKKKTLFDDRPAEIQELTYIIKGDLNSLNQQIARLQEVSKSQRKSTNGKHLLSHSSNMVVALQAKLANMSSDFKQVLEVRTENLKQQKTRRDQPRSDDRWTASVDDARVNTRKSLVAGTARSGLHRHGFRVGIGWSRIRAGSPIAATAATGAVRRIGQLRAGASGNYAKHREYDRRAWRNLSAARAHGEGAGRDGRADR
ncbi:uncharacterized protein LOC131263436 isoform X2 [Anopheles coustani]|uniref:uncharacterized protein LOC131263436 isoform X2 n=1 Tax=Anopheles coustani TaxID=139045 RepID=UPI0026581D39|nr:uncharacterized protein LOC131263436 isoform X2 [Anopheles coustani]